MTISSQLFERQAAAVIGASSGPFGAVWAQAEVRKVLKAAGADVLDDKLPISQAQEAFDPVGALTPSRHND